MRERLLGFAAHQFALDARRPDGSTLRQHYEVGAAQGLATAIVALAGDEELPAQCEHVWVWFGELAAARGSNGWGPNPITWADLAAWQRLTGARPTPREVEWILRLDHAWLKSVADAQKDGGKTA